MGTLQHLLQVSCRVVIMQLLSSLQGEALSGQNGLCKLASCHCCCASRPVQLYWCTAAAAAVVVLVSPQQHKQLGSACRVQLPFVVPAFMSLKETVVTAYDCMQARAMQQHAV